VTTLGTLEELPKDFREAMREAGVSPLWPMMRDVLPRERPAPATRPGHWPYRELRPLLLRAGELTPLEKAERRVLVLEDPGRGPGAMCVTPAIYAGLQLLLPGETAPAHHHTPSAARIVVEGEGAYTVVDSEKCPMHPGDLVLTPGGRWHDHGNDGNEAVVWLDALDLPLFVYLESSYSIEGELQAPRDRPDASALEYAAAGLVPPRSLGRPRAGNSLLRYPWSRVRAALATLGGHGAPGEPVELTYVDPETGAPCLPTLGFTAAMLVPGERVRPPLRSASAVFHVVEGRGRSTIDGRAISWQAKDTFSAPVFAAVEHEAEGNAAAFLVRIDDAPLQAKLGFYEERSHP
jgi:gentisate 1,2-dioxygenase